MKIKYLLTLKIAFVSLSVMGQGSIQQIDLALISGNLAKVHHLTDSLLEQAQSNDVLFRKAQAYRMEYKFKRALEISVKLVQNEPDNTNFCHLHAKNLISNYQTDSAVYYLENIFFRQDTQHISSGILLGKIYDSRKDWEAALKVYDKLMRVDNRNTYFLYRYSVALVESKRTIDAIPFLKKSIQLDNEFIKARHLLHKIYRAMEEHEMAFAQLDTIKQLDSDNPEWFEIAGHYHAARSHYYRAYPEFIKAIDLGLVQESTMHYTGRCLYHTKEYRKAIPYLKYNESISGDSKAFYELGMCYYHLDILDSAEMYIKKSIGLTRPNGYYFFNTYQTLSEIKQRHEEYQKAIQLNEQLILLLEGEDMAPYFQRQSRADIAEIYAENLSNPEKALTIYENLLAEIENINSPYEKKVYQQRMNSLKEEIFFKGN